MWAKNAAVRPTRRRYTGPGVGEPELSRLAAAQRRRDSIGPGDSIERLQSALSCRFKNVEKSFFDAAAADFETVDETASAPDVEDLLASDVSIFRLTRKAA